MSFYFSVDTVLEKEADLENEAFIELNTVLPSNQKEPASGDEIGLMLCSWAKELWKQATWNDGKYINEEIQPSKDWLVFDYENRHENKGLIQYSKCKPLIEKIRRSAKDIESNSNRLEPETTN